MRRNTRPTRAPGALLALVASAGACSPTPSERVDSPETVESTAAPAMASPGPVADQTPPRGTFGLATHGNLLWIADLYAGQVLAVDPDSGSIVERLASHDGVSPEVNDVTVNEDGTLFWLGYTDGAVAILSNNEYKTFAQVMPGTYSLALSADRTKLYAGGAVGRPSPVWTIDLTRQDRPTESDQPVAIRSFDAGQDGLLYGPRFGSASAADGVSGALLQVDPVTGASTELVGELDGPIAVKLSKDEATAHVLLLPPGGRPSIVSVDLANRTLQGPAIELRTPLADNLAVADDGRIFVSSYNDSLISVVGTDGQVKTLHIGQPKDD
jgi:sugar lactone lactonase YvrE